MKRILLLSLLVALVASLAVAQEAGWPRTLTDGLGNAITISAAPRRIVSLSLGVDETLLPILGPERFAAVTALSRDPGISNVAPLAERVPNAIVSAENVEEIIALEPDLLFVASFTAPEIVQQLRDAGLTLFATGFPVGLDEIRANARLIAQAVGAESAVEAALERMDAELASVATAVEPLGRVERALYLTPGNYTSGVSSTIAGIITAAGGEDVAAAAGIDQLAPVSDEFIIERDPDVILLSGWTPWDPTFVDTFRSNPAFAGLSAVQNNRVYVADEAHLSSVSPFIVEGVKDVAAYLYPDAYPAYPVVLRDASAADVSIPGRPDTLVVASEAASQAVELFLSEAGNPGFDVLQVDAEDAAINAEGETLIFVVDPAAAPLPVSGAARVTTVVLYPGDTPAQVAENLRLIGAALGERVAGLNTLARYTDALEAGAGS